MIHPIALGIDKRISLLNISNHELRAYKLIENQADSSGSMY